MGCRVPLGRKKQDLSHLGRQVRCSAKTENPTRRKRHLPSRDELKAVSLHWGYLLLTVGKRSGILCGEHRLGSGGNPLWHPSYNTAHLCVSQTLTKHRLWAGFCGHGGEENGPGPTLTEPPIHALVRLPPPFHVVISASSKKSYKRPP